jgi:hypothetical protein
MVEMSGNRIPRQYKNRNVPGIIGGIIRQDFDVATRRIRTNTSRCRRRSIDPHQLQRSTVVILLDEIFFRWVPTSSLDTAASFSSICEAMFHREFSVLALVCVCTDWNILTKSSKERCSTLFGCLWCLHTHSPNFNRDTSSDGARPTSILCIIFCYSDFVLIV